MSITFKPEKNQFLIETENTVYAFHIAYNRFLRHDYYGTKTAEPPLYKAPYHSFSPYHEDAGVVALDHDRMEINFSLADDLLEFPFFGSGDFRCTALRLRGASGDSCTSFDYKSYEIFKGRRDIPDIPFAKANENTETLAIKLTDGVTGCDLTLFYTVFAECDVITRYFALENNGGDSVKLEKAMSLSLDLPGHDFDMISFYGAHVSERNYQRTPLFYGNQRVMSRRGASSHQFNPFIALADKNTNEGSGEVYAFNFVFSGCFLDEVEVDQSGNTRVAVGLGDENFAYMLEPGEAFVSPEAVMVFSNRGFSDMSYKMHCFVRRSILPAEVFEQRPVVLNTWEACYFDIDEHKLLDFARVGRQCGMDMLVVDDGWFGKRNNDKAGLGDWYANPEKFPKGLKYFAEQIKEQGMKFGIWIEPEMVNPDSDLYRAHPDWCLTVPSRTPSLSRNQFVLDFCNPAVLEYLEESFQRTFEGVPIDYIKWDFNRHISEAGSAYLPAERQDEVFYRFQLGVYRLYDWFTEHFPNTMIENCSGGGGRYDLAMMALSTQIWTSDNTDACARNKIQYASTFGYPAAVMSCHVSDPGNDENTPRRLAYKFSVALGGMLGYELNVLNAQPEVLEEIKKQIVFYRGVEPLMKNGRLYRLISPFENKEEISAYYYADGADRILLSFLQNKRAVSNKTVTLKIAAADENAVYTDAVSGGQYSGAALQDGISVLAAGTDQYARLWLFEKNN